jgi:hypothetical protein
MSDPVTFTHSVQIRWQAADGEVFAPGCLDRQIGADINGLGPAMTLRSYRVARDGTFIDLELIPRPGSKQ